MKFSSHQGDPKKIDRLESKLKSEGYVRIDTLSSNQLKPGQYLRHEFRGTATSFEGIAQARIEWCVHY